MLGIVLAMMQHCSEQTTIEMTADFKTKIKNSIEKTKVSLQGLQERTRFLTSKSSGTSSWSKDLIGQAGRLQPSTIAGYFNQLRNSPNASFYGKLITIIICAYFLADVAALGVGTLIPEPNRRNQFEISDLRERPRGFSEYEVIVRRNLINSEGMIPGEDAIGEITDPGGTPVRTTLPLNLVGTVVFKDPSRSVGTIQNTSDQKVYTVRAQDEIRGVAKILSVEPRQVIFVNLQSGRKEYVTLPEEPNAQPRVSLNRPTRSSGASEIEQRSPNQFNVPRTAVDEALANFNQVLTQARAVPNFENGVPAGYKLFQIVPGSIYDKLGLKNGDVLCGVNGDPINNPGKAFEMLNELKTANQLELCVKRAGRQQTFSYDIN